MPIYTVRSAALCGIDGYSVTVEADCSAGLPSFDVVGLPGLAVKEAVRRVRSAYTNAVGEFQKGKITVNLAPADTEKETAALDLPIFAAICGAFGVLYGATDKTAFIGELSLSGTLRGVRGILAYTSVAKKDGIERIIVPSENASEAALIDGIEVIGVENVREMLAYLNGQSEIASSAPLTGGEAEYKKLPDFSEVRGQYFAKRAMEIAAAGGHNIALIGPPGSGKSMLAKRLPSILPPLGREDAVEVTKIWSVAGMSSGRIVTAPPFRSPHHTVSPAGLSGGGHNPRPGEISLAHRGVLFLDELPEFSKSSLEILRQPIEDKKITISRAAATNTYPADFMLVAAANPCRCGNFGSDRKCSCTEKERRTYMSHISGPLLDRIDLIVEVPAVQLAELESNDREEASEDIRKRVVAARERQKKRLSAYGVSMNSQMTHDMIMKLCRLTDGAKALTQEAFDFYGLTARSYDRLLRTAQTVADLQGSEEITEDMISEVIAYRTAEKTYFFRG